MPSISLVVNGRTRQVDVDADTPLLWVLRDTFALTGTKFGCGVGICGACSVLQDGKVVRSCQIPIGEAAGKRFTTIEGLSPDGRNRCQLAWIEEDVAQCGYCQPGMIMTACALLETKKNPSDADIDAAMDESICRCGTYPRIRKAIHRAARSGDQR